MISVNGSTSMLNCWLNEDENGVSLMLIRFWIFGGFGLMLTLIIGYSDFVVNSFKARYYKF